MKEMVARNRSIRKPGEGERSIFTPLRNSLSRQKNIQCIFIFLSMERGRDRKRGCKELVYMMVGTNEISSESIGEKFTKGRSWEDWNSLGHWLKDEETRACEEKTNFSPIIKVSLKGMPKSFKGPPQMTSDPPDSLSYVKLNWLYLLHDPLTAAPRLVFD